MVVSLSSVKKTHYFFNGIQAVVRTDEGRKKNVKKWRRRHKNNPELRMALRASE
jgi:hypothetical protein